MTEKKKSKGERKQIEKSVISSIAWYILSLRIRNQETVTVLGFCYLGITEKISWGRLALTLESLF